MRLTFAFGISEFRSTETVCANIYLKVCVYPLTVFTAVGRRICSAVLNAERKLSDNLKGTELFLGVVIQ